MRVLLWRSPRNRPGCSIGAIGGERSHLHDTHAGAPVSLTSAHAAGIRRAPDFFLVGHPKCGTTAIYEMLLRHPGIYTPPGRKETGFFDDELPPPPPGSPRPSSLEEYLALFSGARPDQRAGEMTTSYLRNLTAARRIAELAPEARIVAIFREPASFLRSLHMQLVRDRVEPVNDMRTALGLEPARREGREIPPGCTRPAALLYSNNVRYTDQLRSYHEAFPREQVLALVYEDFRRENTETMRRILGFLGVQDVDSLEVLDAHPSVRVRSLTAHKLLRATQMGQGRGPRLLKRAVMPFTTRRVRRKAFMTVRENVVFGKPRPADAELTAELRHRFKPEVEAFGEYLGRDLLGLWGYRKAP